MSETRVKGFMLQEAPNVFVATINGSWLLQRTTPSWRIDDPERGFQRVVREDRAREIAVTVLDQQRTFPNAIVLATDRSDLALIDDWLTIPNVTKFLVVDGQHRLWAQRFSDYEAAYACVIHTGLSEVDMAYLFLEINENQKRVPSSLRWDLVRLVRPVDDPQTVMAAELSYSLAMNEESPLFQRVDLTGEQSEISLKQGSLAPGIRQLLGSKSPLHDLPFEDIYDVLIAYLIAVRDQEPDTWGSNESRFYKARVLRALLRLLEDILRVEGTVDVSASIFESYLEKISPAALDTEAIKAAQGNAGMAAIYKAIRLDVLGVPIAG